MSDRDPAVDRPSDEELVAVVEAILFAAGEPVQPKVIARSLPGVKAADIQDAMDRLDQRFAAEGSGLRVEQVAGGAQIATRGELGPWVRRFFREQNRTRLSPAALEILAIAAYRQPVTAPEIQAIRGKDPSGPLRTLLEKKMIRMMGRKKVIGNPILYGTSKDFLVHFGLNNLSDLPEMEEFEQVVGILEERQAAAFAEADEGGPAEAPSGEEAVAAEAADDTPAEDTETPPLTPEAGAALLDLPPGSPEH